MDLKQHWEKVYATKGSEEVSWYQQQPETSLSFFRELNIPKDAAIIDVGGGDGTLVDYLLQEGYTDITVLDISEKALEKSARRLGDRAKGVNWIVADVNSFSVSKKFDVWHDRAVLHFLTEEQDRTIYLEKANQYLKSGAKVIIGTFSDKGPEKCSGLTVKQYTETSLSDFVKKYFHKIKCITKDHLTPFNTIQNFLFCSFLKTT
ncbi:MAG: class I SAM-dependent methyltransferase [Sphingobacteriales bacterium]|nr:class I SAM-dependent methyltransferase [Sphingobacteriales bacterium]MBI3718063.1 class I SAM-dependent methyltransferase [Sphingobacteriales bacterium]